MVVIVAVVRDLLICLSDPFQPSFVNFDTQTVPR